MAQSVNRALAPEEKHVTIASILYGDLSGNSKASAKETTAGLRENLDDLDRSVDHSITTCLDVKTGYLAKTTEYCVDHALGGHTSAYAREAGLVLGSTVQALRNLGAPLADADVQKAGTEFAVKVSDKSRYEDGEGDGYDEALDGFNEGLSTPRTDVGDLFEAASIEAAEEAVAKASRGHPGKEALAVISMAFDQVKAGDAGAAYERRPLALAVELKEQHPAEWERAKAQARKLGIDKPWETEVRKLAKAKVKNEKNDREELKFHAASKAVAQAKIAEAIAEDVANNEPLSELSVLAYGTSDSFDPNNPYFVSEALRLCNRDFFCVSIDGAVRYVEDLGERLVVRRYEDMHRLFDPVRIVVTGKAQPVNLFEFWSRWKGRRTYAGMGFYPGGKAPPGHFNTWRGVQIKPVAGDWTRLRSHILNVYCGGDVELERWLLDWLAQLIKEPGVKPGSCLVLRSRQEGTGKSLLIYAVLAPILGAACLTASRGDQLTGRFNAHLRDNVLVAAEEAGYAGDKGARGVLKDLITCETMAYEAKGLPIINAPNYSRVIFISNEEWVVPAGPTSRRYCVLDCDNPNATRNDYFGPLFDELKNGGVEAFLHDMLQREITSDLRNPPITAGLFAQREQSLDGFDAWLRDVAQDGQVRAQKLEVVIDLSSEVETEVAVDTLRASVAPFLNPYELRSVDHRLGKLLKSVGATKHRASKAVNGVRPYVYHMPALEDLRAATEKLLGIRLDPSVSIPTSGPTCQKVQTGNVVPHHVLEQMRSVLHGEVA